MTPIQKILTLHLRRLDDAQAQLREAQQVLVQCQAAHEQAKAALIQYRIQAGEEERAIHARLFGFMMLPAPDTPPPTAAAPAPHPPLLQGMPEQAGGLAEARSAFAALMKQSALADRLDVVYDGASIKVSGDLDSEELTRFEALLTPYVKQYGELVKVNASLPPPAMRLPFQITQISAGAPAYVVTDSGVRLFAGGSYMGYRLVSVHEHRVAFAGRRVVEIDW